MLKTLSHEALECGITSKDFITLLRSVYFFEPLPSSIFEIADHFLSILKFLFRISGSPEKSSTWYCANSSSSLSRSPFSDCLFKMQGYFSTKYCTDENTALFWTKLTYAFGRCKLYRCVPNGKGDQKKKVGFKIHSAVTLPCWYQMIIHLKITSQKSPNQSKN